MRRTTVAMLFAGLAAVNSGCGQSAEHQRQVMFEQHCAACHAIAPGQLSPVAAARNLFAAHPSEAALRRAIDLGTTGMPAHLVKKGDEQLVIDYVLEHTKR
jgi:mono/diheme cytochrome c family protein